MKNSKTKTVILGSLLLITVVIALSTPGSLFKGDLQFNFSIPSQSNTITGSFYAQPIVNYPIITSASYNSYNSSSQTNYFQNSTTFNSLYNTSSLQNTFKAFFSNRDLAFYRKFLSATEMSGVDQKITQI